MLRWVIIFSVAGGLCCQSRRILTHKEGALDYLIQGEYSIHEIREGGASAVDVVVVEIKENNGIYSGIMERKVIHLIKQGKVMAEFQAKLYGPRHSKNEIIFRDEIIFSCESKLRPGIKKAPKDLTEADFDRKWCRDKYQLSEYNDAEKSEEFGAVYFTVKSNSEIWWYTGAGQPIKLFRKMVIPEGAKTPKP